MRVCESGTHKLGILITVKLLTVVLAFEICFPNGRQAGFKEVCAQYMQMKFILISAECIWDWLVCGAEEMCRILRHLSMLQSLCAACNILHFIQPVLLERSSFLPR